MKELTAKNMKDTLWDTLNKIAEGKLQPSEGDSIASQAREILRTVNVQLRITSQAKRNVPTEVIDFAEK